MSWALCQKIQCILIIIVYLCLSRPVPSPSVPPTSLALSGTRKKRLVAPTLSLTLSRTDSLDPSKGSGDEGYSAAALSATPDDTPSLDINLEALETPSDSESCTFPDSMHDLEWEGETGAGYWGKQHAQSRVGG